MTRHTGGDDDSEVHKKLLENRQQLKEMKRDGLQTRHVAAYAVGHYSNDLCSAMWFFYLSWYIEKVVKLESTITATCMLSGQLADGFTTPLVGILSDKIVTRFGKRTPWYILGTILVFPCFAGIFSYPNFINDLDSKGKYPSIRNAYYITLPALFNIGWASV